MCAPAEVSSHTLIPAELVVVALWLFLFLASGNWEIPEHGVVSIEI